MSEYDLASEILPYAGVISLGTIVSIGICMFYELIKSHRIMKAIEGHVARLSPEKLHRRMLRNLDALARNADENQRQAVREVLQTVGPQAAVQYRAMAFASRR